LAAERRWLESGYYRVKRLFIYILLGNAPVLEPFQIITQPGMFTFWGTMLLAPCLIMEPDLGGLKRSFAWFFAGFSVLYLLVALLVPRAEGGIFLGFVLFAAGSTALNHFYVKYFKALAKSTVPAADPSP